MPSAKKCASFNIMILSVTFAIFNVQAGVTLINQENSYFPTITAQPGNTSYEWHMPVIVKYSHPNGSKGNFRCFTGVSPDTGVHGFDVSTDWTMPPSLRFSNIWAKMDNGTLLNELEFDLDGSSGERTLGTMTITMNIDNNFDSGKSDGDLYLTCATGVDKGSASANYYNTVYRIKLPEVKASITANNLDMGKCTLSHPKTLKKNLPINVSSQFVAGRLKWSSAADVSALIFYHGNAEMTQNGWYNYDSSPDDVNVEWRCPDVPGKYTYPILLTWEVE